MDDKGLYHKYNVEHADGTPTDPNAEYLVLRTDAGEYVTACRAAAAVFARRVAWRNPRLATDIETRLAKHASAFKQPDHGPSTLLAEWTLPADRECPECEQEMRAIAHNTGDGWWLAWECESGCLEPDDLAIDWPFVEDWANVADLEGAGFEIV